MVFKQEPSLGDAVSLSIECADCGHARWRRCEEFYSASISAATSIRSVASKLFCSPCRTEGLPGKNVAVQVAFVTDKKQREAEEWKLRSQTIRAVG